MNEQNEEKTVITMCSKSGKIVANIEFKNPGYHVTVSSEGETMEFNLINHIENLDRLEI